MVMSYMRLSLNPDASAEFSRYLRNIDIGFSELVRRLSSGIREGLRTWKKSRSYRGIIWETFSSDHPITTATIETLVLAANIGGAAIGKLVGVAVATHLTGQAATTLFITAVGVATGFVGGFILGLAVGILCWDLVRFDLSAPVEKSHFRLMDLSSVAPMPNGHDLAKQMI
ncbi:hypothetical protein PHJA_000169800 [Phtheirospermum japonicum]|uniref:Uncharacterized protein n=1 Tax=Phtheirospermum japonicum TaxID=374723 RepID=A0A830B6L4_9LAMI|nr:hypothetical protein PHJA_000169800 [Phtheirospermum japonicum]